MAFLLPWAVLVAYLLTWLVWVPDEQGPIAVYLPLIGAANFEHVTRGDPDTLLPIIAVTSGVLGCLSIFLFASNLWRSKWGALTGCTALLISEVVFIAGARPRAFSTVSAVPFLILSMILLRQRFAVRAVVAAG